MMIVLSYSVYVWVEGMILIMYQGGEGEVTAPNLLNGPLSPLDQSISGKIPSHLKENKSPHVIESRLHYDEHTV